MGLALCIVGCGERTAPAPTAATRPTSVDAPAASPGRAVATLRGKVRADGPQLTIVALAPPDAAVDTDVASVQAIEIRGHDGSKRQRIDGLDASIAPAFDVLELVDLDFDGHADLRLMESPTAGPNTSYLNWLYQPASGQFVATPALDELPGLSVDASARELRSQWRDGPALYGTDVYTFKDGKLVPIRRERRTYSRPGTFTLEVSKPEGSGWKVVRRSAGRD